LQIGFRPDVLTKLTFVTDHGLIIVSALQCTTRLNCSCYLLNTVLRNTFEVNFLNENVPQIDTLLVDHKALVTHLKRTGHVNFLDTTVHQESETRWYSKHDMCESIEKNYDTIENVLIEKDQLYRLDHILRHLLQMLISFLAPFKEASLKFESDKFPTLPLVIPVRTKLMQYLEATAEDLEELVQLKTRARHFIEQKFCVNKLHRIAVFLWPNFRQLRMMTNNEREQTLNDVRALTKDNTGDNENMNNVSKNTDGESSLEPASKKSKLLDFSQFEDKTDTETEEDEVSRYISMVSDSVPVDTLLLWWKSHELEYPRLSKLAKTILCIPTSSSGSERTSSAARHAYNEKRTCLSSENLDATLFLHEQY
jgi:hypothetical protein